jgi:nucleoside phosphorylase
MKSKKSSTRSMVTARAYRVCASGAFVALTVWAGVATAKPGVPDLAPPADPLCSARVSTCLPGPYLAVFSAFPAELAPLLAAANVAETIATGDRVYHVGTLAGARVVLVRLGIGLVNAATTTRAVLDRFDIAAIVFSGVAGSDLNIGDVAVPIEWSDGTATYPAGADLFAVARTITSPPVVLEQCTPVPPDPPGPMVCLDHAPKIVAGGEGVSEDPFGGSAFACMPGQGPVFGCDEALVATPAVAPAATVPDATDMETAAVARVAHDAGIPYVGFRGVSDGPGDPLGLPGFPAQFFAYYKLSADNAAAAASAFLTAWAGHDPTIAAPTSSAPGSSRSRIGAACDWERAASMACLGARVPRAATHDVTRACGFLAASAAATSGSAKADQAARRARKAWHKAAKALTGGHRGLAPDCRAALVSALEKRATTF